MQWGQPWGTSAWGGLGADTLVSVAQKGQHEILTTWSAFWHTPGFDYENWELSIASGASAPIVVLVEADGTNDRLLLTTDQPIEDGVTYTLAPLATLGGTVPDGADFVGMRVPRPKRSPGLELLDLDTGPLEPMGVTAGGDYKLAAGLVTLKRIVDDRLLTVKRSLSWAPNYGAEWRHKGTPPTDLNAAARRAEALIMSIPFVLEVEVSMRYAQRELQVDYKIRSTLGELRESVGL